MYVSDGRKLRPVDGVHTGVRRAGMGQHVCGGEEDSHRGGCEEEEGGG